MPDQRDQRAAYLYLDFRKSVLAVPKLRCKNGFIDHQGYLLTRRGDEIELGTRPLKRIPDLIAEVSGDRSVSRNHLKQGNAATACNRHHCAVAWIVHDDSGSRSPGVSRIANHNG